MTLTKSSDRWKNFVEFIMMSAGILASLATIPTVIKVWIVSPEHASGYSLTTWGVYALVDLLWIIYGISYRRVAVWSTNLLYLVLYLAVCAGIVNHAGFVW